MTRRTSGAAGEDSLPGNSTNVPETQRASEKNKWKLGEAVARMK